MSGPGSPDRRRAFAIEVRADVAPERLWPLLGEAHRWQEWSFLTRSALERTGNPSPDGVGAIRRFARYGIGSREEVVAWEPPSHLAYILLSGFPVRHYRADVVLRADDRPTPNGAGTVLRWSATFDEMIPGTGLVMTAVLRSLIRRLARDAVHFAESAAS